MSASKTVVTSLIPEAATQDNIDRLQDLHTRGTEALEWVADPWPTPLLDTVNVEDLTMEEDCPEPGVCMRAVQPDSVSASARHADSLPEPSRE